MQRTALDRHGYRRRALRRRRRLPRALRYVRFHQYRPDDRGFAESYAQTFDEPIELDAAGVLRVGHEVCLLVADRLVLPREDLEPHEPVAAAVEAFDRALQEVEERREVPRGTRQRDLAHPRLTSPCRIGLAR